MPKAICIFIRYVCFFGIVMESWLLGAFGVLFFVPLLVYLSAVRKLEKQGRTEEW